MVKVAAARGRRRLRGAQAPRNDACRVSAAVRGMARGKVAAKGIGTDAAMLVPTTTRLCYPQC